jgi:chromosome segregation ATPase
MKVMFAVFVLAAATSVQATAEGSPVSKVFEMLSNLQAKIIKEGEEAQKTYDEFSEWCEDRSKNVGFEIKTGKAEIEDLKATIEKDTATMSAMSTKIEELSASIASNEADLAAASKVRAEEAADFAAEEKELTEVISMLERATAILEREMAKSGASMMQLKNSDSLAQALGAMVQASVFSSADAGRLTAFVQNTQDSDDDALGAPDPSAYKGHSDGIIGTLDGLLEKAENQLAKAQKTEQTSLNNYQMLKQSLTDEIEFANKDMDAAKKTLAASQESKATAEGDLDVTTKDLSEDKTTLSTLHQDCMDGAEDFESETKSRGEELKALATAKKVLQDALGAAAQTYGAALDQASFLQIARSGIASSADLAQFEAVRFVRDLARKQNSVALAQLASRMASAIRLGEAAGVKDPFAKVKGLISDMIATLEAEGKQDASHKEYCDKENSETKAKTDEKKYEADKLSTKIDSMSAKSAKLKEEVATLQKELAQMASSQSEMDKIRADEKAVYEKNSAEMEAGIDGVKKALQVLKEYYAKAADHGSAEGAGSSIIGLLEVCESDFTKGLNEMRATESSAAMEYEKVSKENEIATTMKSQDVKYKTKEAAGLDKSVSETSSDLEGVQAELSALQEYQDKLDKMCVAKAEPYAERKARRESEIEGLKEALSILEGEAVLLQQTSKRALRGIK